MRVPMKARCLHRTVVVHLTVAAILLALGVVNARAQIGPVQSFGPSIAGRIYAMAIDPDDPDVIYAGGDVCGVFRSGDAGASWQLWNRGLENDDVTSSFWVADLLVLPHRERIADDHEGVYAATLGGIYFFPRTGDHWILLTDYSADQTFAYTRSDFVNKALPVPFCVLAYDDVTGRLYAGAGNRVYRGGDPGLYEGDYSYPALSQAIIGSVTQQYTMWSLAVGVAGGLWAADTSLSRPTGLARQFAFFSVGERRYLVAATSHGIYERIIDGPQPGDWVPIDNGAPKTIESQTWSGFVWGIAASEHGRVYALLKQTTAPSRAAGVFYRDHESPTDGSWHFLDGPSSPTVPPYAADFAEPAPGEALTWPQLLDVAYNGLDRKLDLTTISVVSGSDRDHDEVYVGSHDCTAYDGYFRYGPYVRASGGAVRGWMQFIYIAPRSWNSMEFYSIDWHAEPIERRELTTGAVNEIGWLSNNSMHSNVALKYSKQEGLSARMLMDIYHVPMMSTDAGASWHQVYCDQVADTWRERGMSLATVNDFAITEQGGLSVSVNDFGVFSSTLAAPRQTDWLNWWNNSRYATFGDLEVLRRSNGESELYGERIGKDIWRHVPAEHGSDNEWFQVKDTVAGTIVDFDFVNENTMIVAMSGQPDGANLVVGTRDASGTFSGWHELLHNGVGIGHGANARKLARIPGTSMFLLATVNSVICFDSMAPADANVWLTSSSGSAVWRRGCTDIRSLWIDAHARVAYVGTKGGTGSSIGTVFRLRGPFVSTAAPAIDMLANTSASDHPFGFTATFGGPHDYDAEPNESYTFVRCLEADVNNPLRFYAGLGIGGNGDIANLNEHNGVWLYDANNPLPGGSAWRQVFGASGTSSEGINRPVVCLLSEPTGSSGAGAGGLLIGTDGQGSLRLSVDVSVPPTIAASASAPVWSTGTSVATTVSVAIAHPDELAIETAELDAAELGHNEMLHMWDGGPGVPAGSTDEVAGDGVFTSETFDSNVAAGTYNVTVFAQASDGSYTKQNVTVEAVPYLAKLTNVSSDAQLGLNYSGTPYAAASVRYNTGDQLHDLLVTQIDAPAVLFKEIVALPSGVPSFGWARDWGTSSWRGAIAADYNNDGREDLFLAHASGPVLWKNTSTGRDFTGIDETVVMGLSGLDNVTAACWGDYDRDGWLDLYVVRSVTSEEPPNGEMLTGAQHRLYRNCIGEGGGFVDVTAATGLYDEAALPSLCAAWADVDQDGDLDLFVGNALLDVHSFRPPYSPAHPTSRLFINEDNGTFVDGGPSRFGEGITGVVAATWANINNDGYPDLLVAMGSAGARAYLNDGEGMFNQPPVVLGSESASYNNVIAVDQDIDGWQDILLAPAGAGKPVELLLNKEWNGQRSFAPATLAAGLAGNTPAWALLATDFSEDGDAEVMAGRPLSSGQFFYKTDAATGENLVQAGRVRIRLESPEHANNRDGIGATVVLGMGSTQQVQIVDGGSGRGGQNDRDLIFGLGDYQGSVVAKVMWPGGWSENWVPISQRDGAVRVITDTTTPTVANASGSCVIDLSNNTLTWTFTWETDVSSNWQLDELQFQAKNGVGCAPGGSSVMATDGNVAHEYVAKVGGGYMHKLIIANLDCVADCSFKFRVASAVGTRKSFSPWYTKTISFCPSQF